MKLIEENLELGQDSDVLYATKVLGTRQVGKCSFCIEEEASIAIEVAG